MRLITDNTVYSLRMKEVVVDRGGYDIETVEGSDVTTVKGISPTKIRLEGAVFEPELILPLPERVSLVMDNELFLGLIPIEVSRKGIHTPNPWYDITLSS